MNEVGTRAATNECDRFRKHSRYSKLTCDHDLPLSPNPPPPPPPLPLKKQKQFSIIWGNEYWATGWTPENGAFPLPGFCCRKMTRRCLDNFNYMLIER